MSTHANAIKEVAKESIIDSLISRLMMSVDSISVSKRNLEDVNAKLFRPIEGKSCGPNEQGKPWDEFSTVEKLSAISDRLSSLSTDIQEEIIKLNDVI